MAAAAKRSEELISVGSICGFSKTFVYASDPADKHIHKDHDHINKLSMLLDRSLVHVALK